MNTHAHEHTHVELCTRVLFPSLFLCIPLFLSFLLVTYASLARLAPTVLVKHRVVAVHGALTTMQMLLKKPDNRLAAILMASNTVRVCEGSLFGKSSTLNPTPMCVCVCVCVCVCLSLSLSLSLCLSVSLFLSLSLSLKPYSLNLQP